MNFFLREKNSRFFMIKSYNVCVEHLIKCTRCSCSWSVVSRYDYCSFRLWIINAYTRTMSNGKDEPYKLCTARMLFGHNPEVKDSQWNYFRLICLIRKKQNSKQWAIESVGATATFDTHPMKNNGSFTCI